jgi:CHASE3 domain sensor protein
LHNVKPNGGGIRWSGRERLGSHHQVVIGLGGLLALFAAAVGLAVFLIVSLTDDAREVSARNVQYATAIHGAALRAKAMANDERGFLLSSNPEYLEQLDRHTAEARMAFALAADYAVSAVERAAVEQARVGFERWHEAVRAGIVAHQTGFEERAVRVSLGSTRQLRKKYEQSLGGAYELGARSIDAATESLSSSAKRSVTVLLVYLGFALLIGVAIAVWVIRAVLGPAFALSRNAIEVLTRGRLLVKDDGHGSHHAITVEVPVEIVNALAESALQTREGLRLRPSET